LSDKELSFEQIANELLVNKISTDPSELHGILSGMVTGGMHLDNQDWINSLADFINSGDKFPEPVDTLIYQVYETTVEQLLDGEFSFSMLLPDDLAPIAERAQSLISWVQGFLLGFGVQQEGQHSLSDEIKEALADFSEIAKMESDMPESEESEQALFEVEEYVRISAMLCFTELGKTGETDLSAFRTIH
jgi:yecA family protein